MYFGSNDELVDYLKELGFIRSKRVEQAFRAVDRKDFVPDEYKEMAYFDKVIPIGYGQTTSQPSLIAQMLEELDIKPGMKVLEIGTGSGYVTALLSYLVGPEGKVISIERIPELAEFAKRNLSKYPFTKNVEIIVGDGTLGYPKEAPYDRIYVGAAAPEIPKPLLWQLKENGIMIIPVGPEYGQTLYKIIKKKDKIEKIPIEDVIFVPLIGKYGYDEEEWK